jgi:hypothetical protein
MARKESEFLREVGRQVAVEGELCISYLSNERAIATLQRNAIAH